MLALLKEISHETFMVVWAGQLYLRVPMSAIPASQPDTEAKHGHDDYTGAR